MARCLELHLASVAMREKDALYGLSATRGAAPSRASSEPELLEEAEAAKYGAASGSRGMNEWAGEPKREKWADQRDGSSSE